MAQVSKMVVSISATSRAMACSEVAEIKNLLAKQGLDEIKIRMTPQEDSRVPLEVIFKVCCAAFNVREENVMGRSRNQELVFARHAYHAIARREKYSLQMIAKVSLRNHATVLHSEKISTDLLAVEDRYYTPGYIRALNEVNKLTESPP